MKIYLDNCCYNRPFDDQEQLAIYLETEAKLDIQRRIKNGELQLVSSFMLTKENNDNPFNNRKEQISAFITAYTDEYVGIDNKDQIISKANQIMSTGIKAKDAIHAACAMIAKCDYLITTDKRLLKLKSDEIKVIDPIAFIRLED